MHEQSLETIIITTKRKTKHNSNNRKRSGDKEYPFRLRLFDRKVWSYLHLLAVGQTWPIIVSWNSLWRRNRPRMSTLVTDWPNVLGHNGTLLANCSDMRMEAVCEVWHKMAVLTVCQQFYYIHVFPVMMVVRTFVSTCSGFLQPGNADWNVHIPLKSTAVTICSIPIPNDSGL